MSGRDSDFGGTESTDNGNLEAVTDLDSNGDKGDAGETVPTPGGRSEAAKTEAEQGAGALDDTDHPTITIPPPIPAAAVREPGAQRIPDTPEEGSEDERASDAEQALRALLPFYEEKDESEQVRLSDLDDISLRIDPDKLPSLAPLPLPAPEKRSPLLVRGAIVLAVAGAGAAAWALGFQALIPVEPAAPEPAPSLMVAAAPAAAPTEPPKPEPEPPQGEQPAKEGIFEFSLDQAAPSEPARGSSERSDRAKASGRRTRSDESAASADTKSKRIDKSGTGDPKPAKRSAGAGEEAASSTKRPYDGENEQGLIPSGSETLDRTVEEVAASPATPEPVTATATAAAAASATTPPAAKSASGAADREPVKETLSRDEVAAALNEMKELVKACVGDKHGIAKVGLIISASGRVRHAVVTGVFAGTREGSCIARTVRAARFSRFSGEPVSVEFHFAL